MRPYWDNLSMFLYVVMGIVSMISLNNALKYREYVSLNHYCIYHMALLFGLFFHLSELLITVLVEQMP